MTQEQRDKRNAYRRKWYARNKDKVAAQQERYWAKRLASAADLTEGHADGTTEKP